MRQTPPQGVCISPYLPRLPNTSPKLPHISPNLPILFPPTASFAHLGCPPPLPSVTVAFLDLHKNYEEIGAETITIPHTDWQVRRTPDAYTKSYLTFLTSPYFT